VVTNLRMTGVTPELVRAVRADGSQTISVDELLWRMGEERARARRARRGI
jgi:hypothetical protein